MAEALKGFSIIICTYNGAARLPQTLAHIAALDAAGLGWELMVVNNGCTDNTDTIVLETWDTLGKPAPLSLLHMPTPGKSHALTLAFQQAQYKYLVICDDDNRLLPDYLRMAYEILENNCRYGIIGGKAIAVADIELPLWFAAEQNAYACGTPAGTTQSRQDNMILWGAGMVLRREVARAIMPPGYPTVLTGRRGGALTAGEDDEKCMRSLLLGFNTCFDERLVLHHFMPAERLTENYLKNLKAGFAEQGRYIDAYRRVMQYVHKLPAGKTARFRGLKWILQYVVGNQTAKRMAGEQLFLATGLSLFSTPYISHAFGYWKYIQVHHKEIIRDLKL